MISSFSAHRVLKLRERAMEAARPTEGVLKHWSVSSVDPMNVLAVFEPLQIKPGYTLRAYQYSDGANGNGFVWAIPEGGGFHDSSQELLHLQHGNHSLSDPPRPPDALEDVMEAIEGDSSPYSYLCASLLFRELLEFGAMWHGCCWEDHVVLDRNPWQDNRGGWHARLRKELGLDNQWQWHEPSPPDWRPTVVRENGNWMVSLMVHSWLGMCSIYRYVDTYAESGYQCGNETHVVATGEGGMVY